MADSRGVNLVAAKRVFTRIERLEGDLDAMKGMLRKAQRRNCRKEAETLKICIPFVEERLTQLRKRGEAYTGVPLTLLTDGRDALSKKVALIKNLLQAPDPASSTSSSSSSSSDTDSSYEPTLLPPTYHNPYMASPFRPKKSKKKTDPYSKALKPPTRLGYPPMPYHGYFQPQFMNAPFMPPGYPQMASAPPGYMYNGQGPQYRQQFPQQPQPHQQPQPPHPQYADPNGMYAGMQPTQVPLTQQAESPPPPPASSHGAGSPPRQHHVQIQQTQQPQLQRSAQQYQELSPVLSSLPTPAVPTVKTESIATPESLPLRPPETDYRDQVPARPPKISGGPRQVVEAEEVNAEKYISGMSLETVVTAVSKLASHMKLHNQKMAVCKYTMEEDSDKKWRERKRLLDVLKTVPKLIESKTRDVPFALKGWAMVELVRFYNNGCGPVQAYDQRFRDVVRTEQGGRDKVTALGMDPVTAELVHVVVDHIKDVGGGAVMCDGFAKAMAPYWEKDDLASLSQTLSSAADDPTPSTFNYQFTEKRPTSTIINRAFGAVDEFGASDDEGEVLASFRGGFSTRTASRSMHKKASNLFGSSRITSASNKDDEFLYN